MSNQREIITRLVSEMFPAPINTTRPKPTTVRPRWAHASPPAAPQLIHVAPQVPGRLQPMTGVILGGFAKDY